MANVAIIPARGGSKRFPGKNIANFNGKPLITWTLDAAIKSELFDEIFVTSDDKAILEIAGCFPVRLLDRPKALSGDEITVDEVCLEILKNFKITKGILACLYATSPMRSSSDIIKVFSLVSDGTFEKAYAVTSFDLPVNQAVVFGENNELHPIFPDDLEKREEKFDKVVVDNGSTYVVNIERFISDKSLISGQCGGVEMPRNCSIDINYKEDLALLESMNNLHTKER